MREYQTVTVRQDFDVIVARSRVRDMARRIGLKTTDQARISLATSLAARAMGLGSPYQGQIVIECLNGGDRTGMRVVCCTRDGVNEKPSLGAFGDARFMADELTVEQLPSRQLQVTLLKWAG